MKIWVDDVRPAPPGYLWYRSTNETIKQLKMLMAFGYSIEVIDLDHDAGDYAKYGGDYIKILDWLERIGYNPTIHLHSMNPVGVLNMRAIIERNGWLEI